MSEIKTKIRTYNDVIDLFGEEKAADMLSEALDWSTIDPKNDKKNIMERKPLLLDPYMTYEGEDYCKHIVAGFLGDRDLDWASGYIDEEKIKNGQVMPSDLKSALSMALDNELSTSWAYLDALSSQCAEICNKFAGYIESAGLARGVLVPGELDLRNVREQYPELIDSNGEIVWNDPDFMKRGVTFDVENFGEKYKLELVCDSYLDNGSLYVGAYDVTPESDNFGERWADISVNLNNPCQNDRTVFLDMNNLYNPAIIEAIYGLGTVEGIVSHSGFCSYPAFTFDADVISQMRNTQEFMDANTPDDYKLVAVKVGYNFALVPKIELSGIETNATKTIVDISGKQYGLLAGRTFEDSQKLDAVLDAFPEYAIKDYKVPNKISVFIMPVQMYWKDDPSEIIETNFSFEDTCGLAIDDSVTFSGYTQNELVDMIGREDNGEDFVITGVGAGHYVGTCKNEPSKNKSVSEKTCNARESSGRLDADRNVDRNDIAKDKEVK